MYPSVAIYNPFPCDSPESVINQKRLETVEIENDEMYFEGEIVEGLVKVKVLPPRHLIPFLVKKFGEKVYGVCCNKCLETSSISICDHPDSDRALVDTYTVVEIVYAVSHCGYRILKLYELMAFR